MGAGFAWVAGGEAEGGVSAISIISLVLTNLESTGLCATPSHHLHLGGES